MAEENVVEDKEPVVNNSGDNDAEDTTGNTPPADTEAKAPVVEDEDTDGEEPVVEEGEEPAAEDENEDPEATDDTPLDTETWGSTGDEVGDSVLELLQNAELTTDEAKALMYDAVKEGDPSKIDKEALIEKVGKAKANLIMAGAENFITKNNAKITGIMETVHETTGGKEAWDTIAPWAKANMDAAELAEYASMIDKGGAQAKFAATQIKEAYNSDKNTTSLTGKTIEGDTGGKSAPIKGITKREYAEQLERANRFGDKAAIAKIQRAREAGRKQGI